MKSNRFPILLALILLFTFLIRVYQFGDIPHGLNRDEAAIGYTAYLLINKGMDEHGRKWPLRFESFGDWKQPMYIYLTMPLVWAFGLEPWVVRLPSMLFGLVMIVDAYVLTNLVLKKRVKGKAGLIASLLLAVNPWHFHFSHMALEALVAATLLAGGMIGLQRREVKWQLAGLLWLLLSFMTYHSALIVLPVWLVGYVVLADRKKWKSGTKYGLVLLSLIILTMLSRSWFSSERVKVSGTTIFGMNNEELWQEIYQHRTDSLASKLWVNKYMYWTRKIVSNYADTFSPEFLLNRGGKHPHFNIPGFGNFYAIEIVLAVVGAWWVIKSRSRLGLLVLMTLMIAPLPAAITRDGVHSTRGIFMLPYVQVLAGVGGWQLYKWLKKKTPRVIPAQAGILSFLALFLFFQATPFLKYYWSEYKVVSDDRFDGYMRDVSHDVKDLQEKYQKIYMTIPFESPYVFYAFYNRMDAGEFFDSVEYYPADRLGFVHVRRLENIYYPVSDEELNELSSKDLENAVVISRTRKVGEYLKLWKNLAGEVEMMAW